MDIVTGFISINDEREAVVQCSLKPLSWDEVEKNFIQEIQLGTDFDVSFVTEFSPVVAVVANEVSNLAEGFVRDNCLL